MSAVQVVTEAEALGITLVADGPRLRIRPRSLLTPDLIQGIRAHKAEILHLLALRGWPEECLDTVARFGHPSARLYPFVGSGVASSAGTGRLVYVGEHRAAITPDKEPGRLVYLLPGEVYLDGVPRVAEDFGVEVN